MTGRGPTTPQRSCTRVAIGWKGETTALGNTYLKPATILGARLFKIGAQIDF